MEKLEPKETNGVKDWLEDGNPFAAPQEPNNDGEDKEELPNVQYVEIKGGTTKLPEDWPAEEGSGWLMTTEPDDVVPDAAFPAVEELDE